MEQRTDRVSIINGLIDFILLNVRLNADKLKDYRVVPVPDLQKKLNVDLLLTSLTASLTATQGTLSDLTTLKRVGDVTLTSQGNTLYVNAPIALDILHLVFHHYTLQVAMIKKSGDKLELNIKKTYFDAFLMIRFDGLDCEIVFEKFSMLEFNGIDVDITGFSFLNPIAVWIAEWIVDYFNNYIIKEIAEEYARNLLNLALSDKHSLQRLFGYAISGMVLESSKESSKSDNSVGVENFQISRSVHVPPVAPLRHRRNTANSVNDNQKDQNSSYTSTLDRPAHTTSSSQLSRPNNAQSESARPRIQMMNGSAGSRLPEGTLKNNLSAGRNEGRNEIIIRPKKLFSSKSSGALEVKYIPVKPTML